MASVVRVLRDTLGNIAPVVCIIISSIEVTFPYRSVVSCARLTMKNIAYVQLLLFFIYNVCCTVGTTTESLPSQLLYAIRFIIRFDRPDIIRFVYFSLYTSVRRQALSSNLKPRKRWYLLLLRWAEQTFNLHALNNEVVG